MPNFDAKIEIEVVGHLLVLWVSNYGETVGYRMDKRDAAAFLKELKAAVRLVKG